MMRGPNREGGPAHRRDFNDESILRDSAEADELLDWLVVEIASRRPYADDEPRAVTRARQRLTSARQTAAELTALGMTPMFAAQIDRILRSWGLLGGDR